MRLWTIHPKYLDRIGLIALWRESLLAQKVLAGETKGYINHPQLIRFYHHPYPQCAVGMYLHYIFEEAASRGYTFNKAKIGVYKKAKTITTTEGQLLFEWNHLRKKLWKRDRIKYWETKNIKLPEPHPLFTIIKGDVELWETRKTK